MDENKRKSGKNNLITFTIVLFIIMMLIKSGISSLFNHYFADSLKNIFSSATKTNEISNMHGDEPIVPPSAMTVEVTEAVPLEEYHSLGFSEFIFDDLNNINLNFINLSVDIIKDNSLDTAARITVYSDDLSKYVINAENSNFLLTQSAVDNKNGQNSVMIEINPQKCDINDINLKGSNGNIWISDIDSKTLKAVLENGYINVEDCKISEVYLNGTSADLSVNEVEKNDVIDISTISGYIDLTSIETNNLTISSTSGNIYTDDISAKNIICKTISADQTLDFEYMEKANLDTRSVSGNITCFFDEDQTINSLDGNLPNSDVRVDAKSKFNVKTSTVSGSIYFYYD